jgi:hypothetical protein
MTASRSEINLLAALRCVGRKPPRTLAEALAIAQRQARRLLVLTRTCKPPVDPGVLLTDPKLEIRYTTVFRRVSGACRWIGSCYVIAVNRREPVTRQRFTVFHELKHAIDGAATTRSIGRFDREGRRPAVEVVADQFAACVLMPERWVMEACRHAPDLAHLANHFGVSRTAMRVRLRQLGLDRGFIGASVR